MSTSVLPITDVDHGGRSQRLSECEADRSDTRPLRTALLPFLR